MERECLEVRSEKIRLEVDFFIGDLCDFGGNNVEFSFLVIEMDLRIFYFFEVRIK